MSKQSDMQMYFDKAVGGILKQGQPSKEGCDCLYRSKDNLKCAIGHLISDSKYVPEMEQNTVAHIIEIYAGKNIPLKWKKYITFLSDLQSCHDYATTRIFPIEDSKLFIKEFKKRAKELAKKYNLEYRYK